MYENVFFFAFIRHKNEQKKDGKSDSFGLLCMQGSSSGADQTTPLWSASERSQAAAVWPLDRFLSGVNSILTRYPPSRQMFE